MTESPETLLVFKIAAGDTSALGDLYDRLGVEAYHLAQAILRDQAAAADAVQESFLAVWKSAALFDPAKGNVRSWLLTVVRNRCISTLRGRKREVETDDATLEAAWTTEPDDVWQQVSRQVEAESVRNALDQLPAEQRATIGLAYFRGLTQTEIASEMRIPLGTVKGRMRLGLEKLRALLAAPSGMARES